MSRRSLPTISTQIVNELTLLTVTNTATNANIHSTITGYTLVSPPSNMVISASGIITWTPGTGQSPGTNLITTIVTNSNPYDLINPRLASHQHLYGHRQGSERRAYVADDFRPRSSMS